MELQWPLILFTAFVAWAAGLFGTQALYALKGEATKAQMPAWVTSAVLLVIGGIAVFLHLEHWERIFNGFGHLTSGITQELIAIVLLAIVAIAYLVSLRKTDEQHPFPKAVAILAIVLSVATVLVMAHSYMMAARPAWNSICWILYVLGNACIIGPATMALICAAVNDVPAKTPIVVIAGAAINAVTTLLYAVSVQLSGDAFTQVQYYFDPTDPTRPMVDTAASMNVFTGEQAIILWVCVVLVGALVPLVVALLARKAEASWKVYSVIILVCALIGVIAMRMIFFTMGVSVFMYY